MSLKLSTSVTESYAFISRYDDAISLGPEPDLGPAPERTDGESDESLKARAEAWAAPLKAWERPLNVARETGDYSPVTTSGIRPLFFKLRPVTVSQWGRLDAYLDRLPQSAQLQLVFRCAVIGLDGEVPMPALDKSMSRAVDKAFPDLGPIMPECFVDLFARHERVISEVAFHVYSLRRPPGN